MDRRRAARILVLSTLCVPACATAGPPLAPGLIDMRDGAPGQTTLATQGGVGAALTSTANVMGGAMVAVEPHASDKLSVPIAIGGGGTAQGREGGISTRVGVRYRLIETLSLGGGFDTSHSFPRRGDPTQFEFSTDLDGVGFDFELGAGQTYGAATVSGTLRPTMLFEPSGGTYQFFAVGDLSFGYAVIEQLQLTAHLWGGAAMPGSYSDGAEFDLTVGYLAGTLGLTWTFGGRGQAPAGP